MIKDFEIGVCRAHQALAEVVETMMYVRLCGLDSSLRVKLWDVDEFRGGRALKSLVVCTEYTVL
jgi:hypothetical protein